MMAGAAHNPAFAKKVGVPQTVAQDFNQADTGTRLLKQAMTAQALRDSVPDSPAEDRRKGIKDSSAEDAREVQAQKRMKGR